MNPRAEVQVVFSLLVDNRGVTPISYWGDCLVVDWGGGRLRAVPGNGRGFNHGRAIFAWALGRSLLGGLLVKCVGVAPLEFLGCYQRV
jgi:hypothetical protein